MKNTNVGCKIIFDFLFLTLVLKCQLNDCCVILIVRRMFLPTSDIMCDKPEGVILVF